jgi:hypothetical protein
MDIFSYAAAPLELTSLISKENQRSLFFTLYSIRNAAFAITLFIIGIWSKKRPYSDAEALHEVCRKTSDNVGRLFSLGLARATIFNDPSLRNEFLKFYQKTNGVQMTDDDAQQLMNEADQHTKR